MMSHRFLISAPTLCLSLLVASTSLFGADVSRRTELVRAIERVRPAVANIHSEKNIPVGNGNYAGNSASNRMSGMGTGVIVDERGYIITNYHVIEDVSSIRVTLVDGGTFSAEVIARDPETDLAMLKIRPTTQLLVMPLGTSEDLLYGEDVIAIGNSYGYEHTITKGIVSALHRDVRLSDQQSYRDLIQTDASINPGNSGGPLINCHGEMIGLNVAIRAGAQGIGFAIPVNDVKRVVTKLMSTRQLSGSWHGIVTEDIGVDETGKAKIVVRKVEPGSPAEKSGLRDGDHRLAVGSRSIVFAYDVERALLDYQPADEVPVQAIRSDRPIRMSLTLAAAPSSSGDPIEFIWRRLGLRLDLEPESNGIRQVAAQLRGGLRVREVQNQSAAGKAGLQAGDILVGLHHWETLSVDNVVYVLNKQVPQESNPLRFFVIRNGQIHRGWLTIPRT